MGASEKKTIRLKTHPPGTAAETPRREISREKKPQRSLPALANSYSALLDMAPVGIYITTLEGDILYANDSLSRMFGFRSPRDMTGKNILSFFRNPDLRNVFARKLSEKGKINNFKTEISTQAGEGKSILINASPDRKNLSGTILDVTEQERAGVRMKGLIESLTAEKEFSEAIFKNTGSGILVLDNAGNILRINQAGLEILKGKNTLLKEKNIKHISPSLEKMLTLTSEPETAPFVTNETVLKTIGYTNSSLLNAENEKIGVIIVFRDLTEMIKLKKELKKKQKFEEIGKLLAGVAHEVRNPLNAISALTEALSMDIPDSNDSAVLMNHIREQVKRLSSLMSDLLNLGKFIDRSDMEQFSLVQICSAAINLWRQSHPSDTHEMRLFIPEHTNFDVLLDKQRFQQIFLNLIENAAQHSPDGSEIQIAFSVHGQSRVKVQVIDRGPGIPAEHLSQVFEPFFTMRRGGTGLGLSIVRHFIEAHDGEITIWNNDPPPGCTVEFQVPLSRTTGRP